MLDNVNKAFDLLKLFLHLGTIALLHQELTKTFCCLFLNWYHGSLINLRHGYSGGVQVCDLCGCQINWLIRLELSFQMDSVEKLNALLDACSKLGIETSPRIVGDVGIIPLFSWYHKVVDRSLWWNNVFLWLFYSQLCQTYAFEFSYTVVYSVAEFWHGERYKWHSNSITWDGKIINDWLDNSLPNCFWWPIILFVTWDDLSMLLQFLKQLVIWSFLF